VKEIRQQTKFCFILNGIVFLVSCGLAEMQMGLRGRYRVMVLVVSATGSWRLLPSPTLPHPRVLLLLCCCRSLQGSLLLFRVMIRPVLLLVLSFTWTLGADGGQETMTLGATGSLEDVRCVRLTTARAIAPEAVVPL